MTGPVSSVTSKYSSQVGSYLISVSDAYVVRNLLNIDPCGQPRSHPRSFADRSADIRVRIRAALRAALHKRFFFMLYIR